jgi:hypothetical protein
MEKRVLRRILGPRNDNGEWRELQNKKESVLLTKYSGDHIEKSGWGM